MNNKGYTIIEVLVAVFIFATAISIATGAFTESLNLLKKISSKDEPIFKLSQNIWLDTVFMCISDYFIKDDTEQRFYLYFDGKPDSISFVTECSLNSDFPSLSYLKVETNDKGSYDLVLYQINLGTMNLREIERAIVFSDIKKGYKTHIIQDASSIYIGYIFYDTKSKVYTLKPEYRFRQYNTLPAGVKISYTKDGQNEEIFYRILNTNGSKNIYNELYYGK